MEPEGERKRSWTSEGVPPMLRAARRLHFAAGRGAGLGALGWPSWTAELWAPRTEPSLQQCHPTCAMAT